MYTYDQTQDQLLANKMACVSPVGVLTFVYLYVYM